MNMKVRVAFVAAVAVVLSAGAPVALGATPAGLTARELDGVSCLSGSDCTAVGSSGHSAAEHWNGRAWSAQATTDAAGSTQARLKAVSCPASGTCMAVGSFVASGGHTTAFAQRFSGGHWTVSSITIGSGWTFSELDGVSCTSASNCMAVGADESQGGGLAPLAEHFNGTSWLKESVPGSGVASLAAVSCPSASTCTAVGSVLTSSPGAFAPSSGTLALRWNGSSWSSETSPGSGQIDGQLTGVSCSSTSACQAVGENTDGQPPDRGTAIAERWNPTAWATESVPAPAGAIEAHLAGVSCRSASDCLAAGFTFTPGSSPFATLLEHWNGTSWTVLSAPAPASGAELNGISCPPNGGFVAIGILADGSAGYAQTSAPAHHVQSPCLRCTLGSMVTPALRDRRT